MDSKNYTDNIVEYATYGIEEHIKPDETVEVNLRDLMFVAATLQELIRFFHNRDHYPTIEDVNNYLGGRGAKRAYDLISKSNYELIRKMLPQYVDDLFGEGVFDSPEMPYYFEAERLINPLNHVVG